MKIISRPGASRFVKAVLASTLFCALPLTTQALTNLDAGANGQNSSNALYPPLPGYNFTANGVIFTIQNGNTIGTTGGVSVDNITNKVADILNFAGDAIVSGTVGATNPIDALTLTGGSGTEVFFSKNVTVDALNFTNNGNAVFANNVILTTTVDNTSLLPNQGTVNFEQGGTITGNIGLTSPLNQITLNSLQQSSKTLELQGSDINAATFFIQDNMLGILGSTLKLNNPVMVLNGNITALTPDEDILDIFQPAIINGNIGTTLSELHLVKVGANQDGTQINGNITATNTIFQTDKNLTLTAFNPTVTGNIDSTAPGTGTLIFKNGGAVTGTIGAANPLKEIDLKGSSVTTVIFGDNIDTTNGLLFLSPAQATTTAIISDNVVINGPIDNQTPLNNIGTLNFAGNATVLDTVGATKSLFAINLTAPGTVNFNDDIFVGTGNINFAPGSSATTILLQDGITLFGNVDNTSGTSNTGSLVFAGNGIVTGQIGATSPVNQLILNNSLIPGAIDELQGNLIQANTVLIKDNGLPGQGTTLKLNNPLMTFTVPGGVTPLTANVDIVDIFNAPLLTTNLGTLLNPLNLVKVGANEDTTLNGNIFATTTQFQGDHTFFLEDGAIINGNVDSIAPSTGTLAFLEDGTVTGTIGATNALNAVELQGDGSTVNFKNDILHATPIYFLEDATVTIADGVNVTGPVDNLSGTPFTGNLVFLGNATASGNIGETSPLEEITLSGSSKTVTLEGDEVNAKEVFFQDDTVNPNTLVLNHDGLVLTGNITAFTPNLDIIDITQPATLNGMIGTSLVPLQLIKLDATTTVNGDVFAQNTQFQVPARLTLGNNSIVHGPITTTVNNQGILEFKGNSTIDFPIGAAGKSLTAVNVNGFTDSTVNLNDTIFAADTNVNNGTLQINGPQTINGNLTVNEPGELLLASTATPLTVTGNFNLENGSILALDFANPITTPSVVAGGAANVHEGATLVVNDISTALATSHQLITVVTGNVGSDIHAIAATSPGILLSLKTQADNINHKLNLTIDLLSPAVFANQSNTIGVATTLGGLIGNPDVNGLLGDIIDSLRKFTSVEELNNALAELAPTVDGAVIEHSFNTALQTFDIVAQRFYEIPKRRIRKLGPTRVEYIASGVNFGEPEEDGWFDDEWRRDDKGRAFWINAFGQYADQKEKDHIQGYRDGTWGLAAGYDFIFNNHILTGFAVSWATGSIHNGVAGDAKTHADSYQFALYGEYLFKCPLYMNWFTGLAYNDYDAFREVIFTDLHFTPEAVYHAWQYSAKAEIGFVQKLCSSLLIVPVASLYYSLLDFKSYVETGAGTADQWVNPNDANRLQGGVGVRLLYDHVYQNGILQPELRLRMFYNFINDKAETTSDFVGGGASFVTSGLKPAPSSYNIGASISTFECAVIATFSYDYVFRKNYESHSGFFRLRYEW